jgi:putative exosortase-associated protein (TIGR04073 family)
MRRLAMAAIIFILLVGFASPGYCDDPLKKLGRGISNACLCVFELWEQPSDVGETDGPAAAWTYGILKGVGMMGVRAVVGIYEILTFPIPFPAEYKPILTDPEFFLEDKRW